MTEIQQESITLVEKIKVYDFYQSKFRQAVQNCGVTVAQIEGAELDDIKLVDMWNTMWVLLPDHPAIHREPFYALCDLCEYPD